MVMNVVVWARVSSREQREGYSLDAQLRATREKAEREGMRVVREFAIAESAKRGADREEFNRMFHWVKSNAKREKIEAILSHKLDRVCRNMRDAVRLQELEDDCGVRLTFVENEFGPGAAGQLSFNLMAAVAQYYSDNLQQEVLKGMNEKVRQGWMPGWVPFGYKNVGDDKNEPVQIEPEKAKAVIRIFDLYSRGDQTFQSLKKILRKEGSIYRETNKTFNTTTLSYILNNRFYIGELTWRGELYPGKHKPIISRALFNACQDILKGRNRRTSCPTIPYSGGLFVCHYCGRAITGEQIRRKQANGGVRVHYYYKCPNTSAPDHPRVRWKQDELEAAIEAEFEKLRMPDEELAGVFREAIVAALADIDTVGKEKKKALKAQLAENKAMQDRLMTGYLNGAIPEETYKLKCVELKDVRLNLEAECANVGQFNPTNNLTPTAVFDFCQGLRDLWHGSNFAEKRELLDIVSSNHALTSQTLYLTKRKPFDLLAEGPLFVRGRAERIRTFDLLSPRQALYQTEPRPAS